MRKTMKKPNHMSRALPAQFLAVMATLLAPSQFRGSAPECQRQTGLNSVARSSGGVTVFPSNSVLMITVESQKLYEEPALSRCDRRSVSRDEHVRLWPHRLAGLSSLSIWTRRGPAAFSKHALGDWRLHNCSRRTGLDRDPDALCSSSSERPR